MLSASPSSKARVIKPCKSSSLGRISSRPLSSPVTPSPLRILPITCSNGTLCLLQTHLDLQVAFRCEECNGAVVADRPHARFCSNACKQRHHRRKKQDAAGTITRGSNADLIAEVAKLYARQHHKIADLTYGKGVFWRQCPQLDVTGSDIVTVPERQYDFRCLPYEDASFDIAVLDPPYIHSPGQHQTDHRYQNAETTKGLDHDGIMRLYADGMAEAKRITRLNGQVWVKCKDQIASGIQRWDHIKIFQMAEDIGLYAKDLFLLEPTSQTTDARWDIQLHARKRHSYLWVFTKTREEATAALPFDLATD